MNTNELKNMLGDLNVLDKPAEREMYSHDIGDIPPLMTKAFFKILPDVVVQPKNIDQIMKVVSVANQLKIPVTTRGAASWGFGGVIPTKSGIVIDLSPFRKILSLDTAAKTVTVEAGARWSDIDIIAKKNGLCLMTYPSSKFSTVGGWISTGGYGINSFKFGHLSNQIVAIKVVTGTGQLRELTSSDPDFKYFVSTEGEFGIIVEAKIKLRQVPEGSFPHLLYFSNDEQAFTFVSRFAEDSIAKGYQPNSIRFLDSNQLSDINQIMHGDFFKKTSGVILEFGNASDDADFSQFRALNEGIEEAPQYVANYLWNERLFGMKTKRLGPTILASEIIIPMKSAAKFIAHAKKIGHSYGVEVAIDSHIISKDKALIMATFLCDSRKRKYVINVPLVAMLTKTAISFGAEPYGLGLWNAAFVNSLYPGTKKTEFKAFKAKTDPNHILNKGKSFSPGGNFLAGIVFSPAFFVNGMNILVATSPVVGKIATTLLGKDKKVDSLDYELTTHACAKCGNCMAVCPAYLVTNNEMVSAKGKIAIAKKLLAGQKITQEEATVVFQCMHCKACEEICQTNLELMALWDALEKRLETKYGRPQAQINEFLQKVDASSEFWDMVERNN